MLRKNIVFGRCQRSLNMCTPAVHGIRVVFDTFSCSRTCTCLAHGCACVSADVTRLDLAHMFDAMQNWYVSDISEWFCIQMWNNLLVKWSTNAVSYVSSMNPICRPYTWSSNPHGSCTIWHGGAIIMIIIIITMIVIMIITVMIIFIYAYRSNVFHL